MKGHWICVVKGGIVVAQFLNALVRGIQPEFEAATKIELA